MACNGSCGCSGCGNNGFGNLLNGIANIFSTCPYFGNSFEDGFVTGINTVSALGNNQGCGCGNNPGCGCSGDAYYARQYALYPVSSGCGCNG